MNVYVETNFVLELVFMREEHDSCEKLMELADRGNIKLIIPAFSLAEPYETLIRRDKERKQLAEKCVLNSGS